jgi:hypothetical protein
MEATQDRRFYFEVKSSSGVPFSRMNRTERRTTTFAKIVQLHTHTHTPRVPSSSLVILFQSAIKGQSHYMIDDDPLIYY